MLSWTTYLKQAGNKTLGDETNSWRLPTHCLIVSVPVELSKNSVKDAGPSLDDRHMDSAGSHLHGSF